MYTVRVNRVRAQDGINSEVFFFLIFFKNFNGLSTDINKNDFVIREGERIFFFLPTITLHARFRQTFDRGKKIEFNRTKRRVTPRGVYTRSDC